MLERYAVRVTPHWTTLLHEVHRGDAIVPAADGALPCPAVRRAATVRVRDSLTGIWSSVPVDRLRLPLDGLIEGDVVWLGPTAEAAVAYKVTEAPEAYDSFVGRSLARATISLVGGRA